MTKARDPIEIVIVDDHPVVREGIRHMLGTQDDFAVVGEADDGRAAIDLIRALRPHIALMDLQMPTLDGVAAITKLAESGSPTKIMVLTTYDTDAHIFDAIDAGAAGYILKDAPADRLFEAVRAVARGEPALAPHVADRLMGNLRNPGADTLTARELEVVNLAAGGRTNRHIAQALHIGEATVKSHLVHIYRKLGVDDRTHAVTIALKRGLIRIDDAEE